ncbi:MAG: sigma factor-like helix-turn-helix DNA-binding protein [Patescibacteria group bacterium]
MAAAKPPYKAQKLHNLKVAFDARDARIEAEMDSFSSLEELACRASDDSTEQVALNDVEIEKMKNYLKSLPEDQQSVIGAVFFEDISLQSWAEANGVARNTAENRMNRGLRTLRSSLGHRERE